MYFTMPSRKLQLLFMRPNSPRLSKKRSDLYRSKNCTDLPIRGSAAHAYAHASRRPRYCARS